MSLLVVGSVAFDAVETPFGKRERMLGGSARSWASTSWAACSMTASDIVSSSADGTTTGRPPWRWIWNDSLEEVGPDPVDHAKIAIKLLITVVIVVLVAKNRKFATIPRGLWGLIGGLTIANAAVAVLWQ